jgi:hypothetical protein
MPFTPFVKKDDDEKETVVKAVVAAPAATPEEKAGAIKVVAEDPEETDDEADEDPDEEATETAEEEDEEDDDEEAARTLRDPIVPQPPYYSKPMQEARAWTPPERPPFTLAQAAEFAALTAGVELPKMSLAASQEEHPFTYCMDHIIPKLKAQGREPDDPNAFCAWWKKEQEGA